MSTGWGHAPGPWTVEPYVDAIDIHDANGVVVAHLADRTIDPVGMPPENARLIAAAPELLRYAIVAAHVIEGYPELKAQLEGAIAKATGQAVPA